MKFDTFLNTAQESLRFSIAFQEYFHEPSLTGLQRDTYEAYLKSRKRSVLIQIIKDCDHQALNRFLEKLHLGDLDSGDLLVLLLLFMLFRENADE